MGQNSCQPEGLQPESALAALLVLAIERLLPSPGALPSPILAATHTCFVMLGTLNSSVDDRVSIAEIRRDFFHEEPDAVGGDLVRHRADAEDEYQSADADLLDLGQRFGHGRGRTAQHRMLDLVARGRRG